MKVCKVGFILPAKQQNMLVLKNLLSSRHVLSPRRLVMVAPSHSSLSVVEIIFVLATSNEKPQMIFVETLQYWQCCTTSTRGNFACLQVLWPKYDAEIKNLCLSFVFIIFYFQMCQMSYVWWYSVVMGRLEFHDQYFVYFDTEIQWLHHNNICAGDIQWVVIYEQTLTIIKVVKYWTTSTREILRFLQLRHYFLTGISDISFM